MYLDFLLLLFLAIQTYTNTTVKYTHFLAVIFTGHSYPNWNCLHAPFLVTTK